jgi:hypothetical protein
MSRSTKKVIFVVGILVVVTLLRNLQIVVDDLARAASISRTTTDVTEHNDNNEPHVAIPVEQYVVPNRLIHRAEFGLGHRLLRTATAFHLAQHLGMAKISFQWNKCEDRGSGKHKDDNDNNDDKGNSKKKNGTAIFPYLFGKDEWWLSSVHEAPPPPQRGQNILVRNDVLGYLPAQTFLDHRIPLEKSVYKNETGPFLSKILSDLTFYRQLEERFLYKDQVDEFMARHKFRDHRVIGVHVRAGNGETQHFTQAGRGIINETAFVTHLVDLIATHLVPGNSSSSSSAAADANKPVLLFLATDTPYLVPIISNLTLARGFPTVVFPQIRVADHQGVTFSSFIGAGEKCLLGWQAMVIDMLLLSHADILMAARQSSFTQSMPLLLVMARKGKEKGPHFCEVSDHATTMSCFQDVPAWLFRDNPKQEWEYTLSSHVVHEDASTPVRHKSMIHLPEVELLPEFHQLVEFLHRDENHDEKNNNNIWMTYGQKFNPRYRNQKGSDHPDWNFT